MDVGTEALVRPPFVVVLEGFDPRPESDKVGLAGFADLVRMEPPRESSPVGFDGGAAAVRVRLDRRASQAEEGVVVLFESDRLGVVDRQDRVGEVANDEEDARSPVMRLRAFLREREVSRRCVWRDCRT